MLTKELLAYEFATLLDIFNERIKRGEYKKLKYNLQKQLSYFFNNVKIDFHANGEIAIFLDKERVFLTCDDPFAQFLFDYYLPETKIKKEEKNMAVNTATIDNSTITTGNDYLNSIYYPATETIDINDTAINSKIYKIVNDYSLENGKKKKKMNSNITFDFWPRQF